MPTIAVFNQKGGVGKTTTSLNLAAALALARQRPLAIDLNQQEQRASGFFDPATTAPPPTAQMVAAA